MWECQHCTLLNEEEATLCAACEEEREFHFPTFDSPPVPDAKLSQSSPWACPNCTYENPGGFVCEMCRGSISSLTDEMDMDVESERTPFQAGADLFTAESHRGRGNVPERSGPVTGLSESSPWACPNCTYENPGGFVCEMCRGSISSLTDEMAGLDMDDETERTSAELHTTERHRGRGNVPWRSDPVPGFSETAAAAAAAAAGEEQEDYDARRGVRGRELRLVMVGHTGSGKSATANTLLGRDFFHSAPSAVGVTAMTERGRAQRFGRDVHVVDTPGLFDPCMTNEKVVKEITKCIGMTTPGPHAFILVVQIGRFTKEEYDTVTEFKKYFGRQMMNYLIVVFARVDDLGSTSLDQYVGNVPPGLAELLQECGRRYTGFNNKAPQGERDRQAQTLLAMIDAMVAKNGGSRYTNEMYQEAERAMRRREMALRRDLEEKKRKEREAMETEFQKRVKKIREENEAVVNEMKRRVKELESNQCHQDQVRLSAAAREAAELRAQLLEVERQRKREEERREWENSRRVEELERKYQHLNQDVREVARQDVQKEGRGFGLVWQGIKNIGKGIFQGIKGFFS